MPEYELLWECYLSEQMNMAQLNKHMEDDPGFAEYVENKIRERG